VSWGGLLVFLFYSFFKAGVKAALNDWYRGFYDLVQKGASSLAQAESGSGSGGGGSGLFETSEALETAASLQAKVFAQLLLFVVIVTPGLIVHPLAKFLTSHWLLRWRLALVRVYLRHWSPEAHPVEGAAQRIHEDTGRFTDGLQGCFVILVDAVLTLCIFVPVLGTLSADIPPFASSQEGREHENGPWLVWIAVGGALGGLAVSMLVGRPLVGLEVANQRVEACLRTQLVLFAETGAVGAVGAVGTGGAGGAGGAVLPPSPSPPPSPSSARSASPPTVPSSAATFKDVLKDLQENYRRLYRNFLAVNFWLSCFDQTFVILPYFLCAPLLFAEDEDARITLGQLVQVSNAFGAVFGALAVVTDNWPAVNVWRSVYRRLREFEAKLYNGKAPRLCHRAVVAHEVVELGPL